MWSGKHLINLALLCSIFDDMAKSVGKKEPADWNCQHRLVSDVMLGYTSSTLRSND
jgi:hypothetical protein